MAKHVILENYTFTPSTRTIVINGKTIRREQLILITNVTTNTVIYNFSDSSLTASSYSVSTTNNVETTTIILTYNTGAMGATDKLSIIVDETNETFLPAESYRDPVEKLRTSSPQALIDTDFEYGVQSTKWETMSLMNYRPSAFYDPTQGISNISATVTLPNTASGSYQITAATGNGTRLVTISISNTTGITTSTPIYVQDTTSQQANGWYLPASVTANTSITYYARANVTNGSIFDSTKTYLFVGAFYTGSAIPAGTAAITNVGTLLTVTTTNAHGLTAGSGIFIVGTTASTNAPNGAWFVKTVPTSNTFTVETSGGLAGAPTGAITAVLNASIYARSWGSSIHRAYDGGVTFTAGYPYHGNQLIRQTRRYFRYQSGKGIQFSTGSNLCSPWQVDSLTASGTTITVTTKFVHNVNIGATIKVSGSDQAEYNGTFTVTSIPTDTTFTYTATSSPSASPATCITNNSFTVQPYQWYGATMRVGMFDSANGMFFEYDGQTLYAVRRNSTTQLQGYLSSLTNGASVCTGINTVWAQTLKPSDSIVIRGMVHTIVSIESNTSMTIYPEYKGTSIASPSQVIVNKVVDYRIPQSQWNIDKADGTGASGFTLDITKMQMWFIDYAWYGAGTVRWGIRNQRGEVIYCHRTAHGNQMTEAYLRSGNLPARYEVNTFYPTNYITSSVGASDTTITVNSTTGFPSAGNLILQASGNTGAAVEYVSYTGKTSTTFTGVSRGLTNLTGPGGFTGMGGASTGQAFTYSATAPTMVAFWGPQCAATISHWGSSVIMDGRYDDDKAIQFNYGQSTAIVYASAGTRYPVFSIRLSPAVDSGLTGLLGQREIINRMQLQPQSMDVYPTVAGVKIELWLNARVSGGTFAAVGGSSLAQACLHTNTQTMQGGECIYTFFAPAAGVTAADLSKVRDIGNSILGGGNSLSYPTTDSNKYPDGPDILTVAVIPIAANPSVVARMNWTEAQA
jgi:hypothetical protein